MSEAETYHINYHCKNCNAEGEMDVSKQVLISNTICPNCGCYGTLILGTQE